MPTAPEPADRQGLPTRRRTSSPPGGHVATRSDAVVRAARAVAAVVVGLAVLVSGARPAAAHAELSATDPVSGSVVAESPEEVTLSFTEAVSVEADGVRILDSEGERRDRGDASAAGSVVTVSIGDTLGQGGYVVAWRVVSADGHPINGAFQFSVGIRSQVDADIVDEAFGSGSDTRDRQFGNVLRAVAYLATMVAAGATVVGSRLRRSHEPSPVTWWVAVLAAVGVLAIALQVPVQTSLMTGRGWGSVTEAGVLGRALSDGFGWSIGLTVLGLVLIAITAGLPFRGPVPVIALAGGVAAPLGFVLYGHTRTMSPSVVAYAADAAHVLAAAVWFGGLVALLVVMRRRRSHDDALGAGSAVAGFSSMAGTALAVVAVSGLAMGWIEVGGLDALTGTSYGKLLVVKVALVGLVALGGTWNRFRLVPHLAAACAAGGDPHGMGEAGSPPISDLDGHDDLATDAGAVLTEAPATPAEEDDAGGQPADPGRQGARWEALGRILRLEVAALVAVVGVTGVMVNETPAKQAIEKVTRVEAPFGEGTMEVWLSPGRAGRNDVHVILLDAEGVPDDRFEEATIGLSLPAQDVGPIEAEPVRIGNGHFQLVGADLSIRGEWAVTVSVRPDRFTLTEGTATFTVS